MTTKDYTPQRAAAVQMLSEAMDSGCYYPVFRGMSASGGWEIVWNDLRPMSAAQIGEMMDEISTRAKKAADHADTIRNSNWISPCGRGDIERDEHTVAACRLQYRACLVLLDDEGAEGHLAKLRAGCVKFYRRRQNHTYYPERTITARAAAIEAVWQERDIKAA